MTKQPFNNNSPQAERRANFRNKQKEREEEEREIREWEERVI